MEETESIEIDDEIIAAASGQAESEDDAQDDQNGPEATNLHEVIEPPLVAVASSATNLDEAFNDDEKDMTYGRRLARHLSKFPWYNPHVKDSKESVDTGVTESVEVLDVEPPSLDSAWAFFEHYALPRHSLRGSHAAEMDSKHWSGFVKRNDKDVLKRAKYGEADEPTRLYDVIMTPESEFSDFGIGIAIYFWTVRILAFIMLVAGFINLPTMIFFSSTDYSDLGQSSVSSIGVVGSAICTDQVWRACPTCSRDDWSDFPTAYERFASVGSRTFILRNECRIRLSEGIVAIVSLAFMCISIYIMGRVSRRREVHFDETQQTTVDYSIEVENPPLKAKDPDAWKDFFSQFGHVSFCTVTLDNEDLVRALVQRRKLVLQIEYLIKPGVRFDKNNLDAMVENCYPVPLWQKLFLLKSDASTLLKKIRALEQGTIKELAGQEMHCSNVFITFETEQAQRKALSALSVGHFYVRKNKSKLPDEYLFRDEEGNKHVLAVREPPEPSSVRWQDLDETNSKKIVQILASTIVSLVCVAAGAALIAVARRRSAIASAIVISILNQVTPRVCRFINNRFESHSSDGSRQASLYVKMTFFRWTNTVIVTTIILPFSDSLTDGKDFLINSVYAIFFSEILISPLCVLTDSWGHFQRHVMGPRAPDQKRMNLNFRAGYFQLSERFTNVTKILFMTVFYAPFYPNGFFFAAISLAVVYWMDKFCLFRVWGRAPMLGTQIAEFSRNYFFTLALASYAIMLSYDYAGWPFDNACESDIPVSNEYVGSYAAVDGNGVPVTITIEEGDVNYYYCLQDMFRFKNPVAFPALARFQPEGFEWMTSEQETVSNILGWACVAVLFVVAVIFINRILIRFLRNQFSSPYKPRGKATDIGFSEVEEKLDYGIFAYVPQISLAAFQYPLLVCDVSDIDQNLIGWEDKKNGMDSHNVIYDIPELAESKDPLFSLVKEWKVKTKVENETGVAEKEQPEKSGLLEKEESEVSLYA